MAKKEMITKKDFHTFERHEIKYLINYEQRKLMEEKLVEYMRPDPHGPSTVCNIYYDTPDFRLIRHSLEKPIYKEKLRLRSYGKVSPEQNVFLELKKKYKGVVYKRRIELTEHIASTYMRSSTDSENPLWLPEERDRQISREIDYLRKFYGRILPQVHLSYDRCAYFSDDDVNLRLTFDRHIRWRTTDLSLTAEPGGMDLLKPGWSLMEIKTGTALPLWMVDALNEGKMRKTSFSKYGKAYEDILTTKLTERGNKNDRYFFEHNDDNTNSRKFFNKFSGSSDLRGNSSSNIII